MTRTADPYDKLAAMFLTDGTRPDPKRPSVEIGPIELVIVGHLPVRAASIWLTPYADTVAQREGTTALIRLDREEQTIEVRGGEAFASSGGDTELLQTIDARSVREAIMLLGPAIHTWIVRPAASADTAELLGSNSSEGGAGPDRITILSSADQAAVTNVYKLVKELTTTAHAIGREVPRLGLAMIGSPRERSALQARRIDATAREHLDISIPMTHNIAQLGSIRSTGVRSFPGQGRPPLADVLAWINTARARSATATPVRPPAATSTSAPRETPPAVRTEAIDAGIERALEYGRTSSPAPASTPVPPPVPPPVSPPAPTPVSSPVPPQVRAPETAASWLEDVVRGVETSPPLPAVPAPAERIAPTVKLPPRAVTEVEPKHASPPREPDHGGIPVPLALHVTDTRARTELGAPPTRLRPLVARCPGHERIEIALDAAGRLHVLAREEDVRGIPIVQTWAHANRELIAMAHPDETFDPAAPTVAHVFAAEPIRVADLHASSMHLHLLTPIDVDGKRTWYAAPLNRPL